jgi:rRNA maturation endonuclease Nob1
VEFVLIIVVVTSIWVGVDVRRRRRAGETKDAAWSWVAGSLLLWIVVFPLYVWSRTRPGPQKRCPACAEPVRLAANLCKHCGHRFDTRSVDRVIGA